MSAPISNSLSRILNPRSTRNKSPARTKLKKPLSIVMCLSLALPPQACDTNAIRPRGVIAIRSLCRGTRAPIRSTDRTPSASRYGPGEGVRRGQRMGQPARPHAALHSVAGSVSMASPHGARRFLSWIATVHSLLLLQAQTLPPRSARAPGRPAEARIDIFLISARYEDPVLAFAL